MTLDNPCHRCPGCFAGTFLRAILFSQMAQSVSVFLVQSWVEQVRHQFDIPDTARLDLVITYAELLPDSFQPVNSLAGSSLARTAKRGQVQTRLWEREHNRHPINHCIYILLWTRLRTKVLSRIGAYPVSTGRSVSLPGYDSCTGSFS